MRELLKTIFETSRERIKNPFIGTFVLSWIVINWKPIFILIISSKSIEERITHITNDYTDIFSNLLIPLLIAIIYIIILPYFMWLIEELIKKSIIERKKNIIEQKIIDIKGKQNLAKEESELENIKARFRDKADLNKQIEKLTIKLDERDKIIETQEEKLNRLNDQNFELQLIVDQNKKPKLSQEELVFFKNQYLDFKKNDLFDYFKEIGLNIRESNQFPKGLNKIIKDRYLYDEIIERIDDEENQHIYYKFTDRGNFYWKKFINEIEVKKNNDLEDPDMDIFIKRGRGGTDEQ